MISVFFLGFLSLAFLWNLYYARYWNKNLSVFLNFLQDSVYAGEQSQMTEQIENRKKMPLPVLEVAFHMDRKLVFHNCENTNTSDYTYKRDIFALLGYQRITRRLTLDCPKRGYYHIDSIDLTAFSMLHRRRFSRSVPVSTSLYVYAARTNVSDILVSCERLMGNLQCAKHLYEDPFAFSSIREYTLADPMKTINWKASARTGELMVNTFESTRTQQVMIYLDMEDSGILKYEYLIEDSVCVAASLAQKLIGHGIETGIYVNTGICLMPSCGKKHLTAIEQALAKCRSDENIIPFTKVFVSPEASHSAVDTTSRSALPYAVLPEDTATIIISKNAALNQQAIEHFLDRGRQAVWVIPYPRNETCTVKTMDHIRIITREVTDN